MPEQRPDWFKDPPPRRLGSLALIVRGTQVLLIRRTYWTAASQWGLPGGSAAANEIPRRALSRLLDEKLNVRITAGRLLATDYTPEWPGRHREGVNFIYEVTLSEGAEPTANPESGYGEVQWVERNALSALAVDHELLRIEQCLHAVETGQSMDLLLGIPQDTRVTEPPR